MSSVYKGLYIQRFANGEIQWIQVVGPDGTEKQLFVDEYLIRGVEPHFKALPDKDVYLMQPREPKVPLSILAVRKLKNQQSISGAEVDLVLKAGYANMVRGKLIVSHLGLYELEKFNLDQ